MSCMVRSSWRWLRICSGCEIGRNKSVVFAFVAFWLVWFSAVWVLFWSITWAALSLACSLFDTRFNAKSVALPLRVCVCVCVCVSCLPSCMYHSEVGDTSELRFSAYFQHGSYNVALIPPRVYCLRCLAILFLESFHFLAWTMFALPSGSCPFAFGTRFFSFDVQFFFRRSLTFSP